MINPFYGKEYFMTIKPNGSKVTGTKKKDKITWISSSAWKKALTVNAGNGNDVINFKKSKYKNKLNGQNGNDTVYGGTKNDTIHGNAGKDKLYGYSGNDKIYGDSSNDTIYGGKGNDYIDGGSGNDKIYGQYGTNTLKGGSGNDTITGGTGKDKIYGTSGKNYLYGKNGNDSIYGGSGNDYIWGGAGNDYINAGKGTNYIYFNENEGTDTIVNGNGTDTLVLSKETSFNNVTVSYSNNDVILTYSNSTITLKNYIDNNHSAKKIKVNGITKTIDDILPYNIVTREPGSHNLVGTKYKDSIVSNKFNDTIQAFAGNDYIEVNLYNTTIYAGKGNDFIFDSFGMNKYYFSSGDGNDTVQGDLDPNGNHYIFSDETDISGLTITVNDGEGYTIGHNRGQDSVKLIFPTNSEFFENWKEISKYNNAYYDYDKQGTVEVNGNQYNVTTQGFAPIYHINTNTLTTTNDNDYIDVQNDYENPVHVDEIRTLDGDDYITALWYTGENDLPYSPDIYAGRGNDTISGGNIHLYSGDGNDIINGCVSLIFEDETSVKDLNIAGDSASYYIFSYNNDSDSAQVNFEGDQDFFITAGNKKYVLLGLSSEFSSEYYDSDIAGIVGTNEDDYIKCVVNNEPHAEYDIFFGEGNDTLRVYTDDYYLGALFNVDDEENITDNNLQICEYSEDAGQASRGNTFIIHDYLLNSDTKTILDWYSDTTLDISNIDTVKSTVASWLSTNHYADVAEAINDETKGGENLAVLLGTDYFGQLQWT